MTTAPRADLPSDVRVRSKLSDVVYDQILRLIGRGEYPRNTKLPTENELGARFGVSRPVIREALARLRDEGIVRSQQGSGTFVERGPEAAALAYPAIRSVADMQWFYEFRIVVEGQSAYIAAERHTKETLADIAKSLTDAESAIAEANANLGSDLNFAFHRAVARATQNPYFITTLEAIPNIVGMGRIGVRNSGLDDPVARMRAVWLEHESIYRAIADRDGPRARAEMEAHIGGARQYIFQRQDVS
ncbi:MAG: FadR family transcriptional regulator [Alphaproteobacteria bacterium]|nr:FadR family transcriptional regulator [Alphaproteobacteria bacterium]